MVRVDVAYRLAYGARVDYPKGYFYYGKFDNTKNLPKDYVLSKFSGFDGLMSAFLIFKKDKTVEIIP